MKGLRSVTILGEGFQVTLTIQLDVSSYEPFKDCKRAWKADPFFPLLVTSVLRSDLYICPTTPSPGHAA